MEKQSGINSLTRTGQVYRLTACCIPFRIPITDDFTNFGGTTEERDIRHHFHAYTNARQHLNVGPMIIEEGSGIYVTDNSGRHYIEGMAGLWSVGVGFQEQRLIEAATRQKLPFYHNFGHKSHGPAIDFAEWLIDIVPVPVPVPMSKVFFTNSGSEVNDTVLKMV